MPIDTSLITNQTSGVTSFASGFMGGYQMAEKSKEKKIANEKAVEAEQQKLKKQAAKDYQNYTTKYSASANNLNKMKTDLTNAKTEEEYQSKQDAYESAINMHTQAFGSQAKSQEMIDFMNQNQVHQAGRTHAVTVDGKSIRVDPQTKKEIDSNPNAFFIGDDGSLRVKTVDNSGKFTDETQVVVSTNNFLNTKEKQKKTRDQQIKMNGYTKTINKGNAEIKDLNKKYKYAQSVGDKPLMSELKAKIDSKSAEINEAKSNLDLFNNESDKKPNTIGKNKNGTARASEVNKVKMQQSINNSTDPKHENKRESKESVSERISDATFNRTYNLNDANHLKLLSNDLEYLGQNEVTKLYEGMDPAQRQILLLSKNPTAANVYSSSISKTLGQALSSKTIAESEEFNTRNVVQSIVNDFEAAKMNKEVQGQTKEQFIAPLKSMLDGTSAEYYEKQWKNSERIFDKNQDVDAGMIWSSQFDSFDQMIGEFQDVFNNQEGVLPFIQDKLVEGEEDRVKQFGSETFPRLQLAHKKMFPDQPLLQPEELTKMMQKDLEDTFTGREAKVKQDSLLYKLMYSAKNITLE